MDRDMRKLPAHDRGLAFDLPILLSRRRVLTLFAGAGLATLVGCGSDSGGSSAAPTGSAIATPHSTGSESAAPDSNAGCQEIPEETTGPYPGDGSNGPNVLTQSGVVRSDIRSSFGAARGTAEGVPLTINLTVLDQAQRCAARAGAAVYLWHCNREGQYSLYSRGVTDQNYLRGVQETDNNGRVSFTSIFPAAYAGRWPHIHFEIYPSLSAATSGSSKLTTSQLALPQEACTLIYATAGYEQSVRNLARTSLETDNVFADGHDHQLAKVAGDVTAGFTAELSVPV